MQSIWLAASQADCIHVHTHGAAPFVPEDMEKKVILIDKKNAGRAQRSKLESMGRDWNGYHVIMEDAIVYPEG
jgi:hypothetical protein